MSMKKTLLLLLILIVVGIFSGFVVDEPNEIICTDSFSAMHGDYYYVSSTIHCSNNSVNFTKLALLKKSDLVAP